MIPAMDTTLKQDPVYALARSDDTFYAARASGLYHSVDAGRTWHNTLSPLQSSDPILVSALTIVEGTIFAGVKGAVLRSDDEGETWHISGLASPPPLVTALVTSPNFAQDGIITAATAEDGVFLSVDRGQSWTAWNFGLVDMSVYALAISPNFEQDSLLFAGTESGIFCSRNGGRAWEEVDFPMDAAPVLSLGLSPAFAEDGLLYAGTEKSGLFRSNDFGVSWQRVETDFEEGAINSIQFDSSQTPGIWLLLDSHLLVTADGQHFNEPYPDQFADGVVTAFLCPDASKTTLVGFVAGKILSLT